MIQLDRCDRTACSGIAQRHTSAVGFNDSSDTRQSKARLSAGWFGAEEGLESMGQRVIRQPVAIVDHLQRQSVITRIDLNPYCNIRRTF